MLLGLLSLSGDMRLLCCGQLAENQDEEVPEVQVQLLPLQAGLLWCLAATAWPAA